MTSRQLTIRFAVVGTLALGSACASSDDEATEPPPIADTVTDGGNDARTVAANAAGAVDVAIERSRFSETQLFVGVGETVVFENRDEFVHTVASSEASPVEFDSGGLERGERFEISFDAPGEYAYYCQVHPTMRGVVIVG